MRVQSPVEGRRLFEKVDIYQAWAAEERTGFHYRVTEAGEGPTRATSDISKVGPVTGPLD